MTLASAGRKGTGSLAPFGQIPLRCVRSSSFSFGRVACAKKNIARRGRSCKERAGAYHPCRGSCSPFSCIESDRIF